MSMSADTFNRLRPRLHGMAYRMLGSSAEAEDVVQDAWLRWHESRHGEIDNAEAWLVTVTTRLAIACAAPRCSASVTSAPGCPSR
jgi:RNA polymerase sigma-70 factor (ECF subfamily)